MEPKTKDDFIAFERLETPLLMVQASVEREGKTPLVTVLIQNKGREMIPSAFTTDLETFEKLSKQFDKVVQKATKSVEKLPGK